MEFKLNKSQRLVTHAASKDDSRLILRCIHIRKGIVEAANGYVLIEKPIEYNGREKLLLQAKEVSRLKEGSKAIGGIWFKKVKGKVKAKGSVDVLLETQEGTFPQTHQLYPEGEPVFKIALSQEHIREVLNSLDTNEDSIQFYFYGTERPVRFEVNGGIKGLIMPFHIDWPAILPAKKKEKKTEKKGGREDKNVD